MAQDYPTLFRATKTIPVKPHWDSTDSTWFRLTGSLDIDGVTIGGLELRGQALRSVPDRAVCFQLQHFPAKGTTMVLSRVEWHPVRPHTNPKAGPDHLQLQRFHCSHIHRFEDNWLPKQDRTRAGIKVAEPLVPDPTTFQELLMLVGKEFNISGIDKIEAPSWPVETLFGV